MKYYIFISALIMIVAAQAATTKKVASRKPASVDLSRFEGLYNGSGSPNSNICAGQFYVVSFPKAEAIVLFKREYRGENNQSFDLPGLQSAINNHGLPAEGERSIFSEVSYQEVWKNFGKSKNGLTTKIKNNGELLEKVQKICYDLVTCEAKVKTLERLADGTLLYKERLGAKSNGAKGDRESETGCILIPVNEGEDFVPRE